MLAGANFKYTIIGTNALADGAVAAFAPAGIAVGYSSGTPEIETSKESAIHFEDAAPGGLWFAEETNDVRPGTGGGWRLVVKKGSFDDPRRGS